MAGTSRPEAASTAVSGRMESTAAMASWACAGWGCRGEAQVCWRGLEMAMEGGTPGHPASHTASRAVTWPEHRRSSQSASQSASQPALKKGAPLQPHLARAAPLQPVCQGEKDHHDGRLGVVPQSDGPRHRNQHQAVHVQHLPRRQGQRDCDVDRESSRSNKRCGWVQQQSGR